MNKLLSVGIAGLAVLGWVRAQEAFISEVARESNQEPTKTLTQASGLMPKFLDDDARYGETYSVFWDAPNPGLAPGVTVFFEYIMEATAERHALQMHYDFKTVGPRKVVFSIPWKDYREGGNVKAWHVQIVHDGRVLAEISSPDWKTAVGSAQSQTTVKSSPVGW